MVLKRGMSHISTGAYDGTEISRPDDSGKNIAIVHRAKITEFGFGNAYMDMIPNQRKCGLEMHRRACAEWQVESLEWPKIIWNR
jgi:hypothetical protein